MQTTPCTRGIHSQRTCSSHWPGEPIISCPRTRQYRRHRLEPLQRKTLRFAQVGRAELPPSPAVGFPIPVPAPIASPLTASSELAGRRTKGECARGPEPGIPSRGTDGHDLFVSLLLIAESVVCDDGPVSDHSGAPGR